MNGQETLGLISLDPDRTGADAASTRGHQYRFTRLSLPLVMKDMAFSDADPAPGDPVPPFTLLTINGGPLHSADLRKKPTLLVFGSSTCPVTDNAAPGLKALHRRFGGQVRFILVNVREAHPGAAMPQPQSVAAKLSHASRLRSIYDFDFEVVADDLDGTLHRALGPKPNSAYVISRDGIILFRAHWANDIQALATALDAVANGRALARRESGGVLKATVRMLRNIAPVLDRAGSGAWADMWRVAPPLALAAWSLRALGVRPAAAPHGK